MPLDPTEFRKSLQILAKIIETLGEFKGKYDKKFNVSKLMTYLEIPISEVNNVIHLIVAFQEMFDTVFGEYRLETKTERTQVYLTAKKRMKQERNKHKEDLKAPHYLVLHEIVMNSEHATALSDIVYAFQFVRRGEGFKVSDNGSDLLKKLAELKSAHPYFFKANGNGLTYVSELGLELGNKLLTYNKINKKLTEVTIKNCSIKIVD